MNKRNRKKGIFVPLAAVTMIVMLLLPSCYGIAIEYKVKKLDADGCADNDMIILDGNIVANVDNNKLRAVKPLINLVDGQIIDFNVSETDSGKYYVNKTLRINIDVVNGTNDSTLLGRYLTTCIILLKKDRPLISGLLRGLFMGKILNINRTNVFSEGEKHIDISLLYETGEESESVVMHVLAIGTIPNIVHKRIDLEFVYSSGVPQDTTPPVTICTLEGEMIEENVYADKVVVSLEAYDGESRIKQTMQRFDYYNYSTGLNTSSPWEEYDESLVFSKRGEYNFHYYSVVVADNTEVKKKRIFSIF